MSYYTLTESEKKNVENVRVEGFQTINSMKKLIRADDRAGSLLDDQIAFIEEALSHDETSVVGGDYQTWIARSESMIQIAKNQISRIA